MLIFLFLLIFYFAFSLPVLAVTPSLTIIPNLTPTVTPVPTVTLTPTITPTPTPTATPSPTPYSTAISLSEFLANPETGQKEWVELYNTGDSTVSLEGWQIDDIEGGSAPQKIESGTVITAKSHQVIYFSSNKLNNSGDTVRLLNPGGAVQDAFSYGSSQKSWSWAKKADGSWQETSQPTPGFVNLFVTPIPTPTKVDAIPNEDEETGPTPISASSFSYITLSLKEARNQKIGAKLSVEVIITAPPELLGVKTMFVQQDEAGIKIKLADLDYSQLNLGDKVKVSGELKESFNEKYLKDSGQSVTFLEKGVLPKPQEIKTGEVSEDFEGRLAMVNGEVVETSGSTFYLDDGSGRIKIYIKSSTEIEKPKMRKGYFARVAGIVSQYKEDYRILPRFQEDLLVSNQPIGNEVKFEGESWVDLSSTEEVESENGEVLGTADLSQATELPATGASPEILFDPLLAVILFAINLFFRRILTT